MPDHRGWYSRGYLPHFDGAYRTQFITWRTADSLPASVIQKWQEDLVCLTDHARRTELSRRVEAFCDGGHGECPCANPRAARAVQESLFHDHGSQYTLHAWAVMPNHVHVLLTPMLGSTLQQITRRVKSSSAAAVNRVFGQSGRLWQPDYYDHYIRDEEHFEGVRQYIEWNPVKSMLCSDPMHWPWSSRSEDAQARLEFLERNK